MGAHIVYHLLRFDQLDLTCLVYPCVRIGKFKRTCPVVARNISYAVAAAPVIAVNIRKIKQIFYFLPGGVRKCVFRRVRNRIFIAVRIRFIDKFFVSVVRHTMLGRFSLRRKDIIDCVVGVLAHRQVIVAARQHICSCPVGIVCCKVFFIDRYAYLFKIARL